MLFRNKIIVTEDWLMKAEFIMEQRAINNSTDYWKYYSRHHIANVFTLICSYTDKHNWWSFKVLKIKVCKTALLWKTFIKWIQKENILILWVTGILYDTSAQEFRYAASWPWAKNVPLWQWRLAAAWAVLGSVASRPREAILAVCAALVRPHLECWVHAWVSPYKADMDFLEQIQQRATKTTKGLKHPTDIQGGTASCNCRAWWEKARGDLIPMYINTWWMEVQKREPESSQ